MAKGDHCAVYGCSNDRRYPEKQVIKPHVGILRFYSPKTQKDIVKWRKLLNRKHFKVSSNTKVCSNHFQAGYRSEECPNPTLYLKGYCPDKQKKTRRRPSPKKRESLAPKPKRQRRSNICLSDSFSEFDVSHDKSQSVSTLSEENYCSQFHNNIKKEPEDDFGESSSSFSSQFLNGSDEISIDYDTSDEIDVPVENEKKSRRDLFVRQATSNSNCFRYTGVTRQKLDLVFDLIKEKAKSLRYWKGSVDTPGSRREKRGAQPRLLSCWEEFVLTLVRTRKGFDVHFLADTFGISVSQVSRIYNTWIIFLSEELSFLVPWPSRGEIKRVLPERFQRIPNIRVIIDCCEFYIQKPVIPESQKTTWSSYKHYNTAKLLVGITPTGVISFLPPLWTGSTSDKEIVRNSGLINFLEDGDAVMADKGFLIRDLLAFKKVQLISPAYCRGPRLSSNAVTHTRRVAALRSHVERSILRLKHFRILSGVIPLLLKMMLDRIILVCAALSNLQKRLIK